MYVSRDGESEMSNLIVDDNLRTDRQAAFVREYFVDWNGTQAAIRAGYSADTAQEQSSRLLSNVIIRAAIERRAAQIAAVAEVDTAMLVRELLDVAPADVRELVSVHRDCCRCCWGIEHRRQWTYEYETALDAAMRDGQGAPEIAGGIGYNATLGPNPDCPECFGRELRLSSLPTLASSVLRLPSSTLARSRPKRVSRCWPASRMPLSRS
jgi:phage terminase small subunit